jgi:hypothetical protein
MAAGLSTPLNRAVTNFPKKILNRLCVCCQNGDDTGRWGTFNDLSQIQTKMEEKDKLLRLVSPSPQ